METKLYLLLCLPQKYGGYNFERPKINSKIDLPKEFALMLHQQWVKPDFLWEGIKLVVEYDGEYHNDPTQAVRDERRRMVLEAMGYTVLTVKKQLVYDPVAFDAFAMMVSAKLGKRVRSLSLKQQFAREALREALLV